MNCDECKNLISVFLDNELDESSAGQVREHLALCSGCAGVCEDVSSILDVCSSGSPAELVPPNSHALWCRINNIIESEIKPEPPPVEEPRGRFWQFSFAQLAAGLSCIAIVSSLLTFVVIRNYTRPADNDLPGSSAATQTPVEKMLSAVGLIETPQQMRDRHFREQQAAIEYWNARVQSRRNQWDRATRDAFDRNLQVINESVHEYTNILQTNPDDELSGEMLDTVMDDKMNLLRDFSDL